MKTEIHVDPSPLAELWLPQLVHNRWRAVCIRIRQSRVDIRPSHG
jgi:hypothetical protein